MAQPVKHLTLDFGSSHDLTVHGFELHVGLYADSADPAWDSLSSSVFAPSLLPHECSHSLSLSLCFSKVNKST